MMSKTFKKTADCGFCLSKNTAVFHENTPMDHEVPGFGLIKFEAPGWTCQKCGEIFISGRDKSDPGDKLMEILEQSKLKKKLKLSDVTSIRKAAELLGISKPGVLKAISAGHIRAVDMDGIKYALIKDVNAYQSRPAR